MSSSKPKTMNLQISKITIGTWTYAANNPDDIVAKFYFARRKLLWEFLFPNEEPKRLKRKIEMEWDDVSSFEKMIASRNENEIFKIELNKPPTFFIEINTQARKQTRWTQMAEDFTGNEASISRIHTLHFAPGVLQENLKKLLSDSFWSQLHGVRFPTQEAVHFNIDYGSNNNFPSQTPLFSVNNDHHHSQGISGMGVGEGNFDMTTHNWTCSAPDLEEGNLFDMTTHNWTCSTPDLEEEYFEHMCCAPDDLVALDEDTANYNETEEEAQIVATICESFRGRDDDNNNNIASLFSHPIIIN